MKNGFLSRVREARRTGQRAYQGLSAAQRREYRRQALRLGTAGGNGG